MKLYELIEKGGTHVDTELSETLKAGQWHCFWETWELDGWEYVYACEGDGENETDYHEFIEVINPLHTK